MMINNEMKTMQKRLGERLVRFTATLLIAAAVSACGTAAIGPVNHACPGSPARSQGSGCDNRRALVESNGQLYAGRYLDLPQFDAKATAERD